MSLVGHDGVNESETTVIIHINDVNDLPPAFLEQSYNTTIFEETIHTSKPILQVGHMSLLNLMVFIGNVKENVLFHQFKSNSKVNYILFNSLLKSFKHI